MDGQVGTWYEKEEEALGHGKESGFSTKYNSKLLVDAEQVNLTYDFKKLPQLLWDEWI